MANQAVNQHSTYKGTSVNPEKCLYREPLLLTYQQWKFYFNMAKRSEQSRKVGDQ